MTIESDVQDFFSLHENRDISAADLKAYIVGDRGYSEQAYRAERRRMKLKGYTRGSTYYFISPNGDPLDRIMATQMREWLAKCSDWSDFAARIKRVGAEVKASPQAPRAGVYTPGSERRVIPNHLRRTTRYR